MEVICPNCGYASHAEQFEMSLSDECFCPKCGVEFIVEEQESDDVDE